MTTIKNWQEKVHALAREKGWWPELDVECGCITTGDVLGNLCLIHSEVSEAVEDARVIEPDGLHVIDHDVGGKPIGFAIELADAVIRILDLAEALDIDLETAIATKHAYNATRPMRHNGKLA